MDAIRAIFGTKTDGTGQVTGLEMPEKDVILRVAVRQGDGEPIYQDLTFTKVQGLNYATYTGKITAPVGGTGAYKIAAAHIADVGGDTYATPIVGNEGWLSYTSEQYMKVYTPDADGKININMPYATQWQDMTVVNTDAVNSITLNLKPIGTLLRMRIHNQSASQQIFYRIGVLSNLFSMNGGALALNQEYNKTPVFLPGNSPLINYTLNGTTGESIESGAYGKWYYIYVAPRNAIQGEYVYSLFRLQNSPAGAYKKALMTTSRMPLGSVGVTLPYTDGHDATWEDLPVSNAEYGTEVGTPKLSLEYMADGILNTNGDGFATAQTNAGYWNFADAAAKFRSFSINGQNYGLPTEAEAASIFPPMIDKSDLGAMSKFGGVVTQILDTYEAGIKIGNVTQDYKADYIRSGGVTFAVRFKNSTNYNRTAFRYFPAIENGLTVTKIAAVYLGPSSADDITSVATFKFWQDNAAKTVTRTLPFYGFYGSNRSLTSTTGTSHGWTSNRLDFSTGMSFNFGNYQTVPISSEARLNVWPIKR